MVLEPLSLKEGVIHTFDGTWQRITHTASTGVQFYLSSYTYTGNQALDFEIYGLQHEIGSYPTSYIPTYGVSQTRLQELGRSGDYINTSITFGPTDDFAILYDGQIFERDVMILGGGLVDSNRIWIRNTEIRFDGTGADSYVNRSLNTSN